MKNVKLLVCFILIVMILNFISSVYAITGSIGNARMILRLEQGDEIEKYILVKNVNNVSADIEMSAVGDLADDIKIQNDKFTLGPKEDRKAYFTIKVKKPGTTETKINVKFTPTKGGNSVGLSSTIIVIAKESERSGLFNGLFGGYNNENISENQSVNISFGKSKENKKKISRNIQTSRKNWKGLIIGLFSFTLLIIFLVLLIIAKSISKKKNLKIKSKKSAEKK